MWYITGGCPVLRPWFDGDRNPSPSTMTGVHLPLALRVAAPVARPYSWRLAGAGALVLVQVALVLAKPWPLALAVDHALSADAPPLSLPLVGELSPAAVLVLAAITAVVLSGLLGLLDMVLERVSEGTAERIGADLRVRIFDHAITRSLRWHDRIAQRRAALPVDQRRGPAARRRGRDDDDPRARHVMLLGVLAPGAEHRLRARAGGPERRTRARGALVRQRRLVRDAQHDRARRSPAGWPARPPTCCATSARSSPSVAPTRRGRDLPPSQPVGPRRRALGAVACRPAGCRCPTSCSRSAAPWCWSSAAATWSSGSLTTGGLLVVLSYLRDLYSPVRGLTGSPPCSPRPVPARPGSAPSSTATRPCARNRTRGRHRALQQGVRFERVLLRLRVRPRRGQRPRPRVCPRRDRVPDRTQRRRQEHPAPAPPPAVRRRRRAGPPRRGRRARARPAQPALPLRLHAAGTVAARRDPGREHRPRGPEGLDATTSRRPAHPGACRTSSSGACRRATTPGSARPARRLSGGERRRVALARAARLPRDRWCCSTSRPPRSTPCRPTACSAPSAAPPPAAPP